MTRWLTSRDLKPSLTLPNGRRTCRWCGKECEPPRRTWCSKACVDEYLIRSNPAAVRIRLLERDRGICAVCGMDCEWLRIQMWCIGRANTDALHCAGLSSWRGPGLELDEEWRRGRGNWPHYPQTLWEADHIVPVVEGGGACGLENYRTLCWKCHKTETARLAGRRAKARRPQMELSDLAGEGA